MRCALSSKTGAEKSERREEEEKLFSFLFSSLISPPLSLFLLQKKGRKRGRGSFFAAARFAVVPRRVRSSNAFDFVRFSEIRKAKNKKLYLSQPRHSSRGRKKKHLSLSLFLSLVSTPNAQRKHTHSLPRCVLSLSQHAARQKQKHTRKQKREETRFAFTRLCRFHHRRPLRRSGFSRAASL